MSDPQIGQLYKQPREGYPTPIQPGGPGNPVTDPTQPNIVYTSGYTPSTNPTPWGERASFYFPGCGHSIRSWEIFIDTVQGQPAALLCCPVCGWIQSITQPPSLLLTNTNPIVS